MGVILLFWGGIVVVGASDYVIRPRLVGGHAILVVAMIDLLSSAGNSLTGIPVTSRTHPNQARHSRPAGLLSALER
jgi:hypothetical protein